jgi:hypothetical protein
VERRGRVIEVFCGGGGKGGALGVEGGKDERGRDGVLGDCWVFMVLGLGC